MKVLNLVTNPNAQFYQQQVATLQEFGVSETTLAVPGSRETTDFRSQNRSVLDYLRFYPTVLGHALDDYDIVHANYGLTGPAAVAQPTRPFVLTLWGSDLFGRYGWVSKWCANRADAVIVMTDQMADALEPVESHVIPHGVDLARFEPMDADDAREWVGWDTDAKHVLFPYSKRRPIKDFPRAESVVNKVRDRLDESVELHTVYDVPHDHMPLYMNAADALLLTSKHEGSPNSVKEAMACNLPVIATDVGDVGTLLQGVEWSAVSNTDSILVDELTDVLESGDRSNGRAHIEEYGLERMGERIMAVYESIV